MERKIEWSSGCYDEIDLVYEKAEGKAAIEAALSELENMALQEGRAHCNAVKRAGVTLTSERYDALPEDEKEQVLFALGNIGLADISADFAPPKITVTLSPTIQMVLGCTMFNVLNRIEKLDGSINAIFPNVTLTIRAPLGGKKGLMKCEMLIMQLYPWLRIQEVSTDQIAVSPNSVPAAPASNRSETAAGKTAEKETPPAEPKGRVVVRNEDGSIREIHDLDRGERVYVSRNKPEKEPEKKPEKKPGFFQRLFGGKEKKEKNQNPAPVRNTASDEKAKTLLDQQNLRFDHLSAAKERSAPVTDGDLIQCFVKYFAPNTGFYSDLGSAGSRAYFNAIVNAREEMLRNPELFQRAMGRKHTELLDIINNKPPMGNTLICGFIYYMGSYATIQDRLLCVDFGDRIPNCIALYLLLTAEQAPSNQRRQLVDAGDRGDKQPLKQAVEALKGLDPAWECKIL